MEPELDVLVYSGTSSGSVVSAQTKRRKPSGSEVLVAITHSGLCGTDLHYKTSGIALGHEGVGVVSAVGDGVKNLKVGDRVGWGYCHGSCGTCTDCLRGQELYCNHRQIYGSHNTDQGSFASAAVWDEAFLYKIPPTLSSVAAAPLMCAGAAVYSALHHAQVRPTTRVGVLGVGGLGHLAIRFAAKMGCDVVVLSHTAGKQAEAAAYGASEFHVLDGDDGLAQLDRPIDCLFVTASRQPEWARVLPLVRRGGTVSLMTVDPEAELRVPYMDVLMNALRIEGSLPAPRHLHREMLRFAALHGIEPVTEVFPLEREGIERAFERLEKGEMRYRGVLVQAG